MNVQNEDGGAGGQRLKRCIIDLDRLSIAHLLYCITCQVNVESMYVYRRQLSQYLYCMCFGVWKNIRQAFLSTTVVLHYLSIQRREHVLYTEDSHLNICIIIIVEFEKISENKIQTTAKRKEKEKRWKKCFWRKKNPKFPHACLRLCPWIIFIRVSCRNCICKFYATRNKNIPFSPNAGLPMNKFNCQHKEKRNWVWEWPALIVLCYKKQIKPRLLFYQKNWIRCDDVYSCSRFPGFLVSGLYPVPYFCPNKRKWNFEPPGASVLLWKRENLNLRFSNRRI